MTTNCCASSLTKVTFMALSDLLVNQQRHNKIGVSKERLEPLIPVFRQYISFWREYPDLFVDFMANGGDPEAPVTFRFYFYQRVFLRVAMRNRQVYATFPRGYSKSFLAVLVLMVRAILYPGARLFSSAAGKGQSAIILKEKLEDICQKIPAFSRELDQRPKKTIESKDKTQYTFKNGSVIDNIAANERSRGLRRHAGVLEECVSIDGKILQEVLIPTMSISRVCADGSKHPEEPMNKAQLYITTAGYKGTFPYDKLIQTLVKMVIEPGAAYVLGGTYKVPVLTGQYEKNFIQDQKRDVTFSEAAFGREWESKWTGTSEDSYFNVDSFDQNRVVQTAEREAKKALSSSFYVIGMDVGRFKCSSVITVVKNTPRVDMGSISTLVNILELNNAHFEDQAIALKKLYYKYNPRRMVIDANGVGAGFVDYLVKSQIDNNGNVLPPFGVYNDDDGYYKKYKTPDTIPDVLYLIKANMTINTAAYTYISTLMNSNRLKFLIDERTAKRNLMDTKLGLKMSPETRDDFLRPYNLTTVLKEQMMNLRQLNEGVNIILKQVNKHIPKDIFSSLIYSLYYIKEEEEGKKRRKRFKASDWQFMN